MFVLDPTRRELHLKLLYWGPALAGKSTNLRQLHERTAAARRGRFVAIETATERTLLLDLRPASLPEVRGYAIRVHVYAVPGVVVREEVRAMSVKGADAVIFVADSRVERAEGNVDALEELQRRSAAQGGAPPPWVIQYNKRDAASAMPVSELDARLIAPACARVEAIATTGVGVLETFDAVLGPALARVREAMGEA
ncbi:MAG: GTPase domain-containing protein [Nannocystaceae bacterium]